MPDNGLPPVGNMLNESADPNSNLESALAQLDSMDPLSAIWQLIPLMDQLDQSCGQQRKLKQFKTLRDYVHSVFSRLMKGRRELLEPRNLNTCYKCLQKLVSLEMRLIKQLMREPQKNLLPLASMLHHCITDLIAIKVLQYQHYQKVKSGQWVQLNKLFLIAEKHRLADYAEEETTFFSKNKTRVQDLYAVAMLMSCSRLNQLSFRDIGDVAGVLFRWSNLIQLNTKTQGDGHAFLIDVSSGDSPGFQQLMSEQDIKLPCYIYVDKLLERLEGLLAVEDELSQEQEAFLPSHLILEHLKFAWGECVNRQPREPADEYMMVHAGFLNVIEVLKGSLPVENKQRLTVVYADNEDVATIESQREKDIWSSFIFNEDNVNGETVPRLFANLMDQSKDIELAPTGSQQVHCSNRSVGGYCLEWSARDLKLNIGQLLLMKDKESFVLGVIAWVHMSEPGKWQTGVRKLSQRFAPLLLDPPMGSRNRDARPAIFLPADGELLKRHLLILVGDDYKEGNRVQGSFQTEEFQWLLQTRLKSEPEISIYECGFVIAES